MCAAYETLNATGRDTYNYIHGKYPETHAVTRKKVITFFYRGKEPSSETLFLATIQGVKNVLADIEDELDDADGTLYECENSCDSPVTTGWARRSSGYAVHVCPYFFDSDNDDREHVKTLIHELSHLYLQTTDELNVKEHWYDPDEVYISGYDRDGLPQYYDNTTRSDIHFTVTFDNSFAFETLGSVTNVK